MLPSPSVARYQRKHLNTSPHKRVLETLTRRSRLTNLGVFLISGIGLHHSLLSFSTVNRPSSHTNLNHLILVPCHSIWKGTDSWLKEEDWILESYQKGPGRARAFYEHIARSSELANKDPFSLLVFSGGQTKSESSTTEAESYFRLAQVANLLPGQKLDSLISSRATTENYAMDSYQNLLFSIARFREFTGYFPSRITVVGYEFKKLRFTELHREALRWPKKEFNYIGVDPEHENHANVLHGEQQNGYLPFTLDTYGCHSVLLNKRKQRNPYSRFHPYYTSSPELAALLNWCPGNAEGGKDVLFNGPLPWDQPITARDS